MRDTPIILSISMLVSGREEMEKSLDSLHFFKDSFPCEIILVDTGCNPEQRALAEKYADKIVNFTWCNDFAAARNAGLKEARGEWFMYVDDDEWFEDPREMVAFFTSGEYKKYNSATYIQRNYKDQQGSYYVDNYPSRLVKLEPETKFIGRIHEYLDPYRKPKKEFRDFVHHYGYVYKNEEDERKHSQRNVLPLLEMIRENPGEPRWTCQLAQEYLGIRQHEDMLEACKKGLEEWRDRAMREDFVYVPAHVGGLYVYLLIALEILKRYDEEEEWLEKALADPNMHLDGMQPTAAFLCVLGAKLYLNLKDYGKSRDFLRQYVGYIKNFGDDRGLLELGAAGIVTTVFQELFYYDSILSCLEAVIRVEDHEFAEEIFSFLDWDKGQLLESGWKKDMMEAFSSVPYHPVWEKILKAICAHPKYMQEIAAACMEMEKSCGQQSDGDIDGEKLLRVHCLIAGLEYDHWYIFCARVAWAEEEPGPILAEERAKKVSAVFDELLEKYPKGFLVFPAGVWDAAERCGVATEQAFLRIGVSDWKEMLEGWCRMAPMGDVQSWKERMAEWRQPSNVRYDVFAGKIQKQSALRYGLFDVKCAEAYVRHYEETCPDLAEMEKMFWRYADSVLTFYKVYFRDYVFENMPEVLPGEAQLALGLKELQSYREQGNDLKALESMRRCLEVYPDMDNVVNAYAKMLRDETARKNESASGEEKAELRYLINTLKKTAKQYLEKENYQAAREILLQVRQCAPDDKEVEELLGQTEGIVQE